MLAERLKELRNNKGLLQKDIAKYLGITTSAYGFYEQGQRTPDPDTLQRLADFFDVSVDYLLGRTDIRNLHIPEDYKHKVTKRDINQFEEFVEHANAFFMNDQVGEEDKEEIFKTLSELFWKSKEKNKQKYGRKKKKGVANNDRS